MANLPEIFIKQFDTKLPLPQYKTPGAAAFDLSARLQTKIAPGANAYVPLNVAMKLPEGYWAMKAARSSLHKRGIILLNGVGVYDNDFNGDTDEYTAVLHNFSQEPVTIERGERIVQIVILPYSHFPLVAVESLSTSSRGGFGSTGKK